MWELFHEQKPFLKMALALPKPYSVKQGYREIGLMIMTHWAEQEMIPLWDPRLPWQSKRLEGVHIHAEEMAQRNEPRAL